MCFVVVKVHGPTRFVDAVSRQARMKPDIMV